MSTTQNNAPDASGAAPQAMDDPRVVEALEQYLAAIEAGEKPNRQAFLARHGEIAGALADCLDGLDALQAASSSDHRSPGESEAGASGEWQPEAPLGDFRIVREIGRGGMGIVYEAVQLSLGRRVALKVLPFAAALDAKQLQRFKNEAQAAAHLHHQNIVPVYAVGVERGVHFYAMQLIEGQNLAQAIADLRLQIADSPKSEDRGERRSDPSNQAVAPPTAEYRPIPPLPQSAICNLQSAMAQTRPNLSVQLSTQRSDRSHEFFRTIVRLVVQVAEALDYAHGMGIIHRDIKPANLIVDGRGNVWITDFGLAQFQANPGLTQTGDLVGTLRYMSPEQAAGQRVLIDHRTDVYSLGATLYELLSLRPIFDGADRQALLQQIMHEEPRPPRSIDRSIPAELETIVLKAIGKAPSDRYATAGDFADDLHRFLRNEPIRARRATPIQRARKWLRRHPSMLAAGVVLLVLLTVGSLISLWLIHGEKENTRRAYEREKEQFRIAKQSVDDMILLAEKQLADKPHLEDLRMELLGTALGYYQEFLKLSRDDPDAPRAELTATQDRVKKILDDLAVLQGAGQLHLLAESDVLDDLGLSSEKREEIKALSKSMAKQRQEWFHEYRRLSPDERQQRFLQLARANENAVKDILGKEKHLRFKQIALQLRGPLAFRDADVMAALKLTPDQKEQIRLIEAETFFVDEGMCHAGPPPEEGFKPHKQKRGDWPADRPPEFHEKRGASERIPRPMPPGQQRVWHHPDDKQRKPSYREATERIEKLLTPGQALVWRQMTGEAFKGNIRFFHALPPLGPFGGLR